MSRKCGTPVVLPSSPSSSATEKPCTVTMKRGHAAESAFTPSSVGRVPLGPSRASIGLVSTMKWPNGDCGAAKPALKKFALSVGPQSMSTRQPITTESSSWPDRLMNFQLKMLKSVRSEEHTSELQSRLHLVCRLLL